MHARCGSAAALRAKRCRATAAAVQRRGMFSGASHAGCFRARWLLEAGVLAMREEAVSAALRYASSGALACWRSEPASQYSGAGWLAACAPGWRWCAER